MSSVTALDDLNPSVLILGGTGRIGTAFLQQARAAATLRCKLLTRSPSKTFNKYPWLADSDDIAVEEGDLLNPQVLDTAMEGIQQVFFIVPDCPNMVEMERTVYEAARKHSSVHHVVKISAILAGAHPHPVGFGILHRQGEEILQQQASFREGEGFTYTILRPCMFTQSLELFHEPILGPPGAILTPSGEGKIAFVDLRDVAACALEILSKKAERHKNQLYILTGPTAYDMAEVAAFLTNHTGRSVRHYSPPECLSYWIYRLMAGMNSFMASNVRDLFVAVKAGQEALITDSIATICQRAPRTFQDYLLEQQVFPPEKHCIKRL